MSTEYIEIGPTPNEEDCAQVGTDNFSEIAQEEMDAYINQLNRMFPEAIEKGIRFKAKWFPHDFGRYGEVCMFWNTDNLEADEYVYFIDKNTPSRWDEEALKELGKKND